MALPLKKNFLLRHQLSAIIFLDVLPNLLHGEVEVQREEVVLEGDGVLQEHGHVLGFLQSTSKGSYIFLKYFIG